MLLEDGKIQPLLTTVVESVHPTDYLTAKPDPTASSSGGHAVDEQPGEDLSGVNALLAEALGDDDTLAGPAGEPSPEEVADLFGEFDTPAAATPVSIGKALRNVSALRAPVADLQTNSSSSSSSPVKEVKDPSLLLFEKTGCTIPPIPPSMLPNKLKHGSGFYLNMSDYCKETVALFLKVSGLDKVKDASTVLP